MKQRISLLRGVFCCAGILILIIDTKTAIYGASSGIELCIKTVIPSLFPFFLLSNLLLSDLSGCPITFPGWIGKQLKIPQGAEQMYLTGLLGGYPVGADLLASACRQNQISVQDGNRMIAYCCNAGPAFVFGMGAVLFEKRWLCWAAWGITLVSNILVAILTPGNSNGSAARNLMHRLTVSQALKKAIFSMALVCGWVVIFRVLLTFLDRWVLWFIQDPRKSVLHLVVELSNGCCELDSIGNTGLRFVLFTTFLSFGGLCVMMQTLSVLDGSGIKPELYLPGKITQGAISLLLCSILQLCLPVSQRWICPFPVSLFCVMIVVFYRFFTGNRKNSSNSALHVV